MRQSASRNQRGKGGFRLKHALQICLLLAICTWLLYQVKHSHDKKKAFEDKMSKISTKSAPKNPEIFNFGRKGLPQSKENSSMSVNFAKNDENDEEEGEQDRNMKQEEAEEEEVRRDGDDMIDEFDQDRGDEDNVQEEEFSIEEEKDDRVEEDEGSSQEAREENYRRDDASSAVAHDSRVADSRGLDEEEGIEDSKVNDSKIAVNETGIDDAMNVSNVASNVDFDENMTITNVDPSKSGNHSESKELETEFTKHENGSIETRNTTETSVFGENRMENTTDSAVNVSDSLPAIKNGSEFNDSALKNSIIPAQDRNSSITIDHNESKDHSMNATQVGNADTSEKDENHANISTFSIIENKDKRADDNAAA